MQSLSYFRFAAALILAGCDARTKAPAREWRVSKATTSGNDVIPGAMIATLESSDGYQAIGVERTAQLEITCYPHDARVYVRCGFDPERDPRIGDKVRFSYAMGDAPMRQTSAKTIVADSLFIGGPDVITQLLMSRNFNFRFTPSQKSPVTVHFDLRGFPAAWQTIRAVCKVPA